MTKEKLQEIDLLHAETILFLKATRNVESFELLYVSPLEYKEQAPILIEINKKTSSNLEDFQIIDDENYPNKLIKFKIKTLKKDEKAIINFEYYVISRNNEYEYLPKHIKIQNKNDLPKDVKKWLLPSRSVQSDNMLINFRARLLKGFNDNLIAITEKINYHICYNRVLLTNFRRILEVNSPLRKFFFGKRYWTGLMDAISALFFGGACASRTNLGAALLRANNIPTRILIATSNFYGKNKWMDAQHYLFEVYCGEYGWVRGGAGGFPIETDSCIILRINYPSDEKLAGNGFSQYGGAIPWFWMKNTNVSLVSPEKDFQMTGKMGVRYAAPYTRGWIEKKIHTDKNTVNTAFQITRDAWNSFTKYVGMNLSKENKSYFENAFSLQKDAVKELMNSNTGEYIRLMNKVDKYYKKLS